MTEKRFTLTFDDNIVDNLTGIIHDVHSGYDVAIDLSGLLNELNDENEQLKQQMEYWRDKYKQKCEDTAIITMAMDKNGNWYKIDKGDVE